MRYACKPKRSGDKRDEEYEARLYDDDVDTSSVVMRDVELDQQQMAAGKYEETDALREMTQPVSAERIEPRIDASIEPPVLHDTVTFPQEEHIDDSAETHALQDKDQRLEAMSQELHNIWELLQTQSQGRVGQAISRKNVKQVQAWNRLSQIGLRPQLIERLLQQWNLPEITDNKLLQLLAQSVVTADEDVVEQGGVFAFVGPTGVGKTTCIGKIAANYVLQHGKDDIVLITTDNYRIAAHESLKAYGRILNIPVYVHDSQNSLLGLLHQHRKKSLILIDTPGCSSNDKQWRQQLRFFKELEGRVNTLLVMQATSQQRILDASYRQYAALKPTASVVTKLDEAVSLGETLTLLIEKKLPLAFCGTGQMVPDDIRTLTARQLVKQAFKLARNMPSFDGVAEKKPVKEPSGENAEAKPRTLTATQ